MRATLFLFGRVRKVPQLAMVNLIEDGFGNLKTYIASSIQKEIRRARRRRVTCMDKPMSDGRAERSLLSCRAGATALCRLRQGGMNILWLQIDGLCCHPKLTGQK